VYIKMPRVRKMKIEKALYSIENPNPNWKDMGEEWIKFALNTWKPGEAYDVAYIPHIPVELRQGNKIHNVIPTRWDLDENPNPANLYMGGRDNTFRLNARYKNPAHEFVGTRKNVDLYPIEDKETILELLKIANKIYFPGMIKICPVSSDKFDIS